MLLDVVIVCQLMFLLLMRNQLLKLKMQSDILQLNHKYTPMEFAEHVRKTTDEELDKLTQTEQFKNLQR